MRLLRTTFVFANLATVAWSRSVGPWGTVTTPQVKSVLSIPAGGSLDGAKSAAIQGASDKVHYILLNPSLFVFSICCINSA